MFLVLVYLIIAHVVAGGADAKPNGFINFIPHISTLTKPEFNFAKFTKKMSLFATKSDWLSNRYIFAIRYFKLLIRLNQIINLTLK